MAGCREEGGGGGLVGGVPSLLFLHSLRDFLPSSRCSSAASYLVTRGGLTRHKLTAISRLGPHINFINLLRGPWLRAVTVSRETKAFWRVFLQFLSRLVDTRTSPPLEIPTCLLLAADLLFSVSPAAVALCVASVLVR